MAIYILYIYTLFAQHPQDACSKIPGVCFFFSEGAEAPQAAATQSESLAKQIHVSETHDDVSLQIDNNN